MIASAHALTASPFKAGYVAAKHGVLGLVKTLALEGRRSGSARPRSALRSCARRSPSSRSAGARACDAVLERQAVKRLLEPSEVADLVAFLLGPTGRGITGVPVPLDLGWTAA